MSKYREIKTEFKDQGLLRLALEAVGVPFEHHPGGARLVDWLGKQRPDLAHYIVRRRNVGAASNDLGYRVEADGRITCIISDYDEQAGGRELANRVCQQYARQFVHREAARRGLRVHETQDAASNIHIQLRSV